MRPVPRSRHLVAVAIFAAVAASVGVMAWMDESPSDMQTDIAAGALKEHQPDLFRPDPVFGRTGLWQFQSPVFQSALRLILVPTDYQDLYLPFRVMTPIVVFLYLCGMYALIHGQCRSWSVAAFVTVLSSMVVYTIGDGYWGVGSLGSVTPRAICQMFVPFILLAFLRYANQWRLLLVFGFVGLMGNLHLATAMNLTIILLIVYLLRQHLRLGAWMMAGLCAAVAALAALPYAWYCHALRLRFAASAGPTQATAAVAYWALRIAEIPVVYPDLLKSLLYWLLMAGVLALPAVAVLIRVERFRTRNPWLWVSLAGAGLFVALGLSGLIEMIARATDRPPFIIDFPQASSLVMVALYVLFAQALTALFRLVRTHRAWLRWACAALAAAWIIPSNNFRPMRYAALDTATMFMEEADKPRGIQRHHNHYHQHEELAAIGEWVKSNTSTDAVFLTSEREIRTLGWRAVVASDEDIRYIYYCTPWRLGEWAGDVVQLDRLLHPPDGKAEGEAIKRFTADLRNRPMFGDADHWYVILDAGIETDTGEASPLHQVQGNWGHYYNLYRLH